jgi:hypothetical protein
MSLLNPRYEAGGLFFNAGVVFDVMTVLLMTVAATIVLTRLAALVVAPATDLDFLAIAYS